jgi:xanthine dehydrogenase accessory factor
MKRALLDSLMQARAQRRAIVVITELSTGAQRWFDPACPRGASTEEAEAIRGAARDDRCRTLSGDRFVQPYNPPARLIIVGAVHMTCPLVTIAELAGYAVTGVDPRPAFLRAERFPRLDASALRCAWPDEALAGLKLDARAAVVTLTHDPKIDDPGLLAALESPAFYIGALGSRRTHAQRLERLRAEGVSEQQLARIHGPVGLDLGGRSPAEIAISIMAQLTRVLRRGRA